MTLDPDLLQMLYHANALLMDLSDAARTMGRPDVAAIARAAAVKLNTALVQQQKEAS
jgi:hypothetical protein